MTSLSFFCFFRLEEAKLDTRWQEKQSRHMCHMSQGIFEAQAKLFERRGLGFEDETWSNGFQPVDKVKVSFVKKTGIQLVNSRVPHLLPIPASWKKGAMKALWQGLVCYKFHGKSSFVGRSPSRADWEHRNYCAGFGSHVFKPAHFWGRQLAHLLNWFDSLWFLRQTKWNSWMEQLLSLPEVHNTQHVCGCNGSSSWSLLGTARKGPTQCRWLGFCEQKDLHGLTFKHKCGTQFDWQQALKKK